MLVLVTLGLFGRPWSRRRILHEAVLLCIFVGYVFILFGQPFLASRFLVPLLPFLLVWASNGIVVETSWLMVDGNFQEVRWILDPRGQMGGEGTLRCQSPRCCC